MKEAKYSIWSVLRFQFKFMNEQKKKILYLGYIIEPIAFGLIPVAMIVFPGLVIDAIASSNLDDMYFYTILFGLSVLVLYSIHHFMNTLFNKNLLALRFQAGRTFNDKYRFAAFRYLEDPDFQAKRSTALQALRGGQVGFEGLYRFYLRILTGIVSLVTLFFIVGIFNLWVIVFALVLAILQYFISLKSKKYRFKHRDELNERLRKAAYFFRISNNFKYGKDIRVDQMDHALIKKYKEKSNLFTSMFKRVEEYEFRLSLFNVLFLLLINGVTYYLVIHAYFNNALSIGQLAMTIWAITEISVRLQTLFQGFASIKEESGYVSEFMSFLENETYFPKNEGEIRDLSAFKIEFQDVYFKYPASDTYILKNLNLTISSKQKLALVGINGAGKTTIVKLLCGFYHPTKGNIYIDGINIKNLDLEAYRKKLSIVFQDITIYAASILENILGEDITEETKEQAINALDVVGLKDKVMTYPNKENQQLLKIIENDGTELSGGEAQRLIIARAICKEDTNFIALDEPTASLDAIHEKEIYENFKDLIKDRTSIIISHRLASTRFCDKVAFLEHGEIIEYGTHEELMNIEDGKYKNMFITQGKYYQEGGEDNA